MIFHRDGGELVVTTQPDHAFFSGELAALWRADGLPANPRRAEILFAAREHDNGWRGPDAAPRVDPATGRPYGFHQIPRPLRFEIWQAGIDRFADQHPYASLLIAHHAAELHQDQRGDTEWSDFFEDLDERIEDLTERSAATAETLAADYRFVELADLLSLAACSAWDQEIERSGLRFRVDGDTLRIAPLPLAGATTFRVRCRCVADRQYASDADFAIALAEARWLDRDLRVREL